EYDPDVIILNAGQIETEVGDGGVPLVEIVESMNRVNYSWPALVALEAAKLKRERPLDVVAIGSIADGSPSCFGPVYHSGKIALHYYWSGVGPIVYHASNHQIRMRLYRPGVISGPLAWAPVNRLNEKGYKIRANRVNSAPPAEKVANTIASWIEKNKEWVGTYDEPFSFKIFKYLFALFPNFFYKLQLFGWPRGSKFV
ncbi:MAG: SDR family NAD(P)-dependent oxidoreductase, partial [Moorea sp. SIO4G2]|nr:SDR family NAD(P)-dependent oxidoreductase [Moorena sp. SIO4G2]